MIQIQNKIENDLTQAFNQQGHSLDPLQGHSLLVCAPTYLDPLSWGAVYFVIMWSRLMEYEGKKLASKVEGERMKSLKI